MRWFDELLYSDRSSLGYIQRFRVDKVLKEVKTKRQHLLIFETPYFGRVLVIDGVVQTTEKDEFAYHEMLSHVPILAHGKVISVLIVGGGDGGVLKQVLRHPGVKSVTLVEIDETVIELCEEYLPLISEGAFNVAGYMQSGGSAAEGDVLVGSGPVEWTGSVIGPFLPTGTKQGIADEVLDRTDGVESGFTLRQSLRLILSSLAGKLSGASGTTISIRDVNDSKDRLVATVDADGNRTALTLDKT